MSAPGTIAFLEDGCLRAYTGRGLAYAFDELIVIWGPDWLRCYAEGNEYLTRRDGTLNRAFDEAAALVDFDARRLLFYGGEMSYDTQLREDVLALMRATTWQGWDVAYTDHEFREICNYLGRPQDAWEWPDDRFDFDETYLTEMLAKRYRANETSSFFVLRAGDGCNVKGIDTISGQNVLEAGPAILTMLSNFDETPVTVELSQFCAGVLFDEPAREVTYWASSNDGRLGFFRRMWPGWRVEETLGWREFADLVGDALVIEARALDDNGACELVDFALKYLDERTSESLATAEKIKHRYRDSLKLPDVNITLTAL